MRNKLLVSLALIVALAAMAACAAPTAAPQPTTAPAPAVQPTTAPAAQATTAPAAAGCVDANRVPISWSTIAGFYTDAMTTIVKNFEATHCVKVTVVGIDNAQLYDKQIIEAVGKTGAYDVYNIETAEKAGFAENGYILPLDDYIKANADAVAYDDIAPILADITTKYKGHIWGLPYYTYTQGQFYRQDLFDDKTEQAAFKAKYGYDLKPPTTWAQVSDMAQFFTRKTGDKLKGVALTKDFYGIGLMAGRFQEIQDELSGMILWKGSDWLKPDGSIAVDDAANKWALDFYVKKLLPYAPPAALTVTYDGVMNQMIDGQIAMTANFFLDQWPNAVKTEASVPGAKMGIGPGIENTVYIGAFLMGVSSSSKHPKEAMDFVAYVGGKEAQTTFASMGGSSTRVSVLSAPQFNSPESYTKTAHFAMLLKVFDNMKGKTSNLFYSPYGAKLYNAMGPIYHAAAAGEKNVDEDVLELKDEFQKICGGPKCTVNR
ncbi:MAG: sugar ABC transporter substrate-binding protein [Chloroflexi bacterium]|nr:sugar ABC transporter substrate-binding protein [Chloroflexota bacterium]